MARWEQRRREIENRKAPKPPPQPRTTNASPAELERLSRRGSGKRSRNVLDRWSAQSIYGGLPASARVVTQYPDGVSTGVGGGNAGQAQSVDPNAPAYIPPSTGPQRSVPPPNGGSGSGTQTGFTPIEINLDIAEQYAGSKIADVNNFLSTKLPTVDISGSEFDATQRPDGTYNAPQKVVVGGKAVNFSDLDGALSDTVVEGISTPGKVSVTPADEADNKRAVTIDRDFRSGALDDDDERGDFTPDYGDYEGIEYSDHRKAARAAFLSGDDGPGSSMRALKLRDAAVGRVYAGGKNYVNDGGTLREVTTEAGRKQGATGLTAEELKNAYLQPIKETLVPVATKDGFETSSQVPEIYDSGISTKPDVSKGVSGLDYNQQTEFNMNNLFPGDAEDYDLESPDYADYARMKSNYFSRDDDDDE